MTDNVRLSDRSHKMFKLFEYMFDKNSTYVFHRLAAEIIPIE